MAKLNSGAGITWTGYSGDSRCVNYLNVTGPTNGWMNQATVKLTNTSQLYLDVTARPTAAALVSNRSHALKLATVSRQRILL